jgi:uncharacterized membrane protein
MYAPREEKHPEQRAFSMALYVVSAMGAIAQYAASIGMVVAGVIILMLAGFMVKMQRLTARGTIYASHVEWMARTLSIGCKFLFPIAIFVALYLVYKWTDVATLQHSLAAAGDDTDATINLVKAYIASNEDKINRITTWSLTPPILWWVRRCWHGLVRADKSEPIDYPDSLL